MRKIKTKKLRIDSKSIIKTEASEFVQFFLTQFRTDLRDVFRKK